MNISFRLPASPWLIALAFILLVGPFALDFHMHYPDEMYYSDAAVRMMQSEDYLTPYLGDGEMRFKKPILTYWVVLAGFELFGISALSSRLFFLLSGALTILFVYQIGKVLFADRTVAYLACLITASHPVLILSSTRSIPDVLLALFITLSAWGFAGLLKLGDQAPKKYLWMVYVGLGLAFEVKGLPAMAIGGIGLLYLLINPWKRIGLKKLLYFPAILTGLFVAVFWFLAMYMKHGPLYLDAFYSDQMGERVSSRFLAVFKNLGFAILLMIGMFFPWVIFGFKNMMLRTKSMISENRAIFWWVVVWVISILLMSALVTKFYERYLLPVIPLTAVGLAWFLSKDRDLPKSKVVVISMYGLFLLNVLVGLAALFFNVGMEPERYVFIGLLLGILTLVIMYRHMLEERNSFSWLAISILLLFYNGSFITHAISLPHQGSQVATWVSSKKIPKGSRIAFVGHLHTGSKIRIGLGKDYFMTDLSRENYQEKLDQFDYIICEEAVKEQLDQDKFMMETASLNWDPKLVGKMVQGILSGKYREVLEQNGKRYYWGERKSIEEEVLGI